jgi:hypothetical protein
VTDSCPLELDHGVIGNGRVLALVAPSTHGTFALMPDSADVPTHMEYIVNTNVLRTAVVCADGRFVAVTISELLEAREMRFRAWN